jgi:AcrR family transcriptional regulator
MTRAADCDGLTERDVTLAGAIGPRCVAREKAAENRARIVETASRLFRERGFDGVGLTP